MNPINIDEALARDENMQLALKEYDDLQTKANAVAEEISSALIESIVKEEGKFNISVAILGVAKTLSHLASFIYDTEEDFLYDTKKARTSVVSEIIPALLDPQPCGECESCKNGNPSECISPKVRGDYTTSRFLPILCNNLIEYDLFNKVLYMYTAGKDKHDEAAIKEKEESQNGDK